MRPRCALSYGPRILSKLLETVVILKTTGSTDRPRPQAASQGSGMKALKFTFWKDGEYFLGFLNDYPDFETQGMSKEELVGNLKDLLVDLESGEVPFIR